MPTTRLRRGVSPRKVLLVVCDGLRLDTLLSARTPNFDALASRGLFGPSYIQDNALAPTVSGPGHANLMTGVWPDKHGIVDNSFDGSKLTDHPDLFTMLRRLDDRLVTFSSLDWAPLNDFLIGSPDVKLQQNGPDAATTDRQSTDAAVELLTNDHPDVVYVYLHDADFTGHGLGSESPDYTDAVERVDAQLGRLVAGVEARPTYADEDWLILVSTDHGQHGNGHGGDQHVVRTIWMVAAGGEIPCVDATREWRQVDVVPTILDHLDLVADPSWALDGVPLGTSSTDPFDTVGVDGVSVDGPLRPPHSGGWSAELPDGWTREDHTGPVGASEHRGWRLMSGEFWTTLGEGEGRGSFVRGRDVIAVADPAAWASYGEPTGDTDVFDSTLYSPWQAVEPGADIWVRYESHYRQRVGNGLQHAQVVAEFDDGSSETLWSAEASDGDRFEISTTCHHAVTAPEWARAVRIGWKVTASGAAGYWAIDAPSVVTSR